MRKLILLLLAVFVALVMFFACQGETPQEEPAPEPEAAAPAETEPEPAETAEADPPATDPADEFPGFDTLEEAADSEAWAPWFPKHVEYWEATEEMRMTTYGGGGRQEAEGMEIEKIDYLELYPFLRTNYAGFPFSKGYYRSRGHIYALTDVIDTERLPDWDQRPASCMSCKSTDVVVGINEHGDDFYGKSFAEVVGENTVGCLDCHDHRDASVKVQRDYVFEALAHDSFRNIDPEGRDDLTCAQCHVNYYFHEETSKPVLPWSTGLTVEDQLEHYSKARRSDEWEHEITGALVAKIQHPEYELYHEGKNRNIHSRLGVGCTDCHMPQLEDEDGTRYSSHTWTSPLTHVEESCLRCHGNWGAEETVRKTESVQGKVYEKQNRIGRDLADFITAVGEKIENGGISDEELEKVREIQREAQFYWDFIWVENSSGFHNWQEAHRVLDNADELIKEGMQIVN